jgi:benzoate membrane transport protein
MISAALVAALVGYGGTIAIVLAAAQALSASAAQTASWLLLVCLTKAIGSAALSQFTKLPVVLAWSTPGAALIAATSGYTMAEGVAAFLFAAVLIVLTGLIPPLERAIRAIPKALGAAMLAGVLLPLAMKAPAALPLRPELVVPVIAVFLLVRLFNPVFAVLAALAFGLALSVWLGVPALPPEAFTWPVPVFIAPDFDMTALISLGLPLYLVTMASQNLPGFAVLQSAGYPPPVRPALVVSGGLSAVGALFGAHTINMAAITAAICMGPDVHPDPNQRWRVGVIYGGWWVLLGLAGPLVIGVLTIMPPELMAVIAGLALLVPLMGALSTAFELHETRFAAAVTLATGASGVALFGIGAAFWGLTAGLIVLIGERWKTSL